LVFIRYSQQFVLQILQRGVAPPHVILRKAISGSN
jgi:hypothetical protein